jgi:acyl-CoA thioesterase-1
MGDSLSAGFGLEPGESWVSLLDKQLTDQDYGYRTINASISGETTSGGLTRIARALKLHKPGIVIIELGGNDGLRGIPASQMQQNLAAMIDASIDAGARVLLVGIRIPSNYGRSYTEKFRAVFPTLAEQYRVPLIPFLLEDIAMDAGMMQADGIHPNAQAQPLMLELVWEHLEPMTQKLDNHPESADAG